jgi:hypothetical protein
MRLVRCAFFELTSRCSPADRFMLTCYRVEPESELTIRRTLCRLPGAGRNGAGESVFFNISSLNIQTADFQGIVLNEFPARLHMITHKYGEYFIRFHRIFNVDLQ